MTSTNATANTELTPQRAHELGRAAYRPDRLTPPAGISSALCAPELRYELTPGCHFPTLYAAFCRGWAEAADDESQRTAEAATAAPKGTLRISHSSAEGTLLSGSSRGDGVWEIVKTLRWATKTWRYFRSIRAIGVNNSRDKPPVLGFIDLTQRALEDAGWTVEVEIDGQPRSFRDQEDARADRMDDRAAALHDKADRKIDERDRRYDAAQQIAEGIPTGQPVLVGHHSERGHRRDLKRMDGHLRASVEAGKEALRAEEAAQAADRHMTARENPRRVYRRVQKLEADLHRHQRALDGHVRRFLQHDGTPWMIDEIPPADGRDREQLELNVAHLQVQIDGWQAALAQAKTDGIWVPVDLADVKPGHWIGSWAGWTEVVMANRKTVTVWDSHTRHCGPIPPDERFRRHIAIDEITEHRTTSPYEPPPPDVAARELADLDAADAVRGDQPAPAAAAPAARATHELSEQAVDVLLQAGATEQTVHLVGVPPARETFEEVDAWLRHRRGFRRYDTAQRAYVYTVDPRADLAEVTGHMPVRPASGDQDKALAYFATPADLACRMADELGDVGPGRVLEPSAGDGALIAAITAAHPEAEVTAVECDSGRVALLRRRYGAAWHGTVWHGMFQDFADHMSMDSTFEPFDGVLMNPPFTEPGDRHAWAAHFQLAWRLLRPGGRLVAILPASYRFSEFGHATAVRALVETNGGVVTDLPPATFRGAGTGVRTVLIVVTRGRDTD